MHNQYIISFFSFLLIFILLQPNSNKINKNSWRGLAVNIVIIIICWAFIRLLCHFIGVIDISEIKFVPVVR